MEPEQARKIMAEVFEEQQVKKKLNRITAMPDVLDRIGLRTERASYIIEMALSHLEGDQCVTMPGGNRRILASGLYALLHEVSEIDQIIIGKLPESSAMD